MATQIFLTAADSPFSLDVADQGGAVTVPKKLIYTSGSLTINLPSLRSVPGQTFTVYVIKNGAEQTITVNGAGIVIQGSGTTYSSVTIPSGQKIGVLTAVDEGYWLAGAGTTGVS